MAEPVKKSKSFWSIKFIFGTTILGALIFFFVGIFFWGGFNTAMEATNNLGFCISCHEMKVNVYEEYKPTIHYSNRTGVRAGCPDCHVPDPWIHKVARKIQATNELYHKLMGTVSTPEKFNTHRLEMAKRVWKTMKDTDSRECRNCHNFESMNPEFQKPRARTQHLNAFKDGQTCIDCHKGIAHNDVRHLLSDEEREALEAPNPEFIREIPEIFHDGLERVIAKEEAEAQLLLAEKKAAKEAELLRIEAAVAEALASKGASSASASAFDIDWGKAGSREITIFYPGQTSIEWVSNGKYHGGARPFIKGGDRCVTCHDNEAADMGNRMVTGEKAETTPIPGKRGSIPVLVEATHDTENLYLRFSWADGDHVPVPFVEGGMMDPENPMKLAMMFASDDVEFADRSGCWGSCHHDANNMPNAPDHETLQASPLAERLDFSGGVSKYTKESRSKIEVAGRRGKKLGGWDKLKEDTELQAEMDDGRSLDLVRYLSGTDTVEDGHILSERVMSGGQGASFEAKLKGGTWSVIMQRKLKSDNAGDVSFDMAQLYNFGFAIHDDHSASRFHHVSLGYKLGFDNDAAEINAKSQ